MIELVLIIILLLLAFTILLVDDRRNLRATKQAVDNILNKKPDEQHIDQPVQEDTGFERKSKLVSQISPQNDTLNETSDHPDTDADESLNEEAISTETGTKPENTDLQAGEFQNNTGDTMLPTHNTPFRLKFENGHTAIAVRVALSTPASTIMQYLSIPKGPALFITGGAGAMSDEDIKRTHEIIQAVADFAEEHKVTIIDGGTESGIMQMIGDARRSREYTFTLIGVAPLGRVSFPGYKNPNEEAFLEDSHTHFVLVDGDDWGTESELLVGMANAISEKRSHGVIGVLINGGKITRQDVYLAVSKELPILVLEGSGRFADEVATAFKTGKANQSILRAILAGGDIQLVSTIDGPSAMRAKLEERFNQKKSI